MMKRILVALSGTPHSDTAVQYAIELAQSHDTEITGVTITNIEALSNVGSVPVGGGALAHDLAEHRQAITEEREEQAIADFESACRDAGMIHCVVREEGDPFEQLISLWRYHDLTIVGLRGMFEYGVVENPDDYLLDLIKTGVRPILAAPETHRPIQRVLIAYNGSMASAKAMKRFMQAQLWPNLTVKIICFDTKHESSETLLKDAASYCRVHGVEVETEYVKAPAKDHLLEQATQWNADLIVMGADARHRLARFLLGDTTMVAIRNAEIPLYLAR